MMLLIAFYGFKVQSGAPKKIPAKYQKKNRYEWSLDSKVSLVMMAQCNNIIIHITSEIYDYLDKIYDL